MSTGVELDVGEEGPALELLEDGKLNGAETENKGNE
jgi:hypothetical protein